MEHVLMGGLEGHFPFQMGDLEVPAVNLPGVYLFFFSPGDTSLRKMD